MWHLACQNSSAFFHIIRLRLFQTLRMQPDFIDWERDMGVDSTTLEAKLLSAYPDSSFIKAFDISGEPSSMASLEER